MTQEMKERLKALAEKYENEDFLQNDPSKFMHQYSDEAEQEAVAFIAANLAFGRRDQILKHVELILEASGSSPVRWILSEEYRKFFPADSASFYRMYTNSSMISFFDGLKEIFSTGKTAGEFFRKRWEPVKDEEEVFLHQLISEVFPADCNLLPHTPSSAAKKVNMMLRWLVRNGSPVDLGLWDWYPKTRLLMPLDTHVMQEAGKLGLLTKKSPGLGTAIELTEIMKEVFPDDPLKGDFALFGLGVDTKRGLPGKE